MVVLESPLPGQTTYRESYRKCQYIKRKFLRYYMTYKSFFENSEKCGGLLRHLYFHGALSCGFQFLKERYGKKVLKEYLYHQAGESLYGDLIKKQGLVALEEY